jgi:hypothetical protein
MRRQLVIPSLLLLALPAFAGGCQIEEVEFDDVEIGESQQASIGATPVAPQAHHDALAAITILLPPSNPEVMQRTDYRYCTGVLVGDDVVMTAATCLARNLEAQLDDEYEGEFLDAASIQVQFGANATGGTVYTLDATFDDGPTTYTGLVMHRYYDDDFRGTNDVALLKLSASPVDENVPVGIMPVGVNSAVVGSEIVGQKLELVGYGKEDSDGDNRTFTARQVINPDITAVSPTRITAGEADVLTTCFADSGGPGFMDLGNGPVVVSVSEVHGSCDTVATRERADLFASDFVQPFVDFIDGCAGCVPCDYNGVCEEDCPTRDWDCELGAFTGEGCARDGDCEEGGKCIPATDDPAFTYCAKTCDAADPNSCPSTMVCGSDNECIYDGISPGSQGATCSSPIDCRSGFCEDLICANECDAGDASSCDTAAGFSCLPSLADGSTTVCRLESRSGGGGFCAITPAGSRGTGTGVLGGFGLIFLLGLVLRRRS